MSATMGSGSETSSWKELARAAAVVEDASAASEALRQLLMFSIADTPYAVPVESVREIVRIRPITPIPRVSQCVRGVISLRGEVLQVIDLRVRLDLPRAEVTRATRIIVISVREGGLAGLLVDAVTQVLRVPESALMPQAGSETDAVEALCVRGKQFVSLINLERILDVVSEH
ncbi:MAG: chemotaxis protein CheW [Myxococcales bacterium]|nr:chemotaxis protein CheW [Myxococcales bacterium]